jgi:hypothetical protein
MLGRPASNQHLHGPWILQDINDCSGVNYHLDAKGHHAKWHSASLDDEKFEWNSDRDDTLDDEDMNKVGNLGYIDILGFHPYKQIIFFSQSLEIGLAYHLNSSRIEVLGNLSPTNYDDCIDLPDEKEITTAFPYTPCLIEMCPRNILYQS